MLSLASTAHALRRKQRVFPVIVARNKLVLLLPQNQKMWIPNASGSVTIIRPRESVTTL